MTCTWTRRDWLCAAAGTAFGLQAKAQAAEPQRPIQWPVMQTITGEHLDTSAWLGVPTVVVFWATWCAYCKRHNAHVDKLYRRTDPKTLRVLTAVIDGDDAGALRYMQDAGYSFPVVRDGEALRRLFTPRKVVPMTCLVDRNGLPGTCFPGEMSESDLLGLASPRPTQREAKP